MTGENWTNEQWYAWARYQIEIERRYYEQMYWENLRRQRAWQREQDKWRNKMHRGDDYTYDEKRRAAISGLMDLLIGAPFKLISKLFGG
jgi:hypothetical protein